MSLPLSHPFLSDLPSVKEIEDRVKEKYEELFVRDSQGNMSPLVCTICDEFIMKGDDKSLITSDRMKSVKELLSWSRHVPVDFPGKSAIVEAYEFEDKDGVLTDSSWLKGMALSPRGSLIRPNPDDRRAKAKFTCCSTCKVSIEKKRLPFYAIVNQNFVGNAPECLLRLTPVELALITPMKSFGYVFHYAGGMQRQLRGTMVFMRVNEGEIAEALAQADSFGLSQNVIVLKTGSLTKDQNNKVDEKNTIRVDQTIEAVEWLTVHHPKWRNVNLPDLREKLRNVQPIVIDHSEEAESVNANVEAEELFTCYLPDGANTTTNGGVESIGTFKEYVDELRKTGFEMEMKINLNRKFVKQDRNDTLLSTGLLQFPHGTGGLDVTRVKSDGSSTTKCDLNAHMTHLSRLSQPVFQTPMFQLIVHSMLSKVRLLNRARLQLRGKTDAKNLAEGLHGRDIRAAINHRRTGNRSGGTRVSRKLLDSVDACSQALPHTNEAAKKARSTGEAMQHHFAAPSLFVTASFDDDNSILMQVLSGVRVDDDQDPSTLTDDELSDRAQARRQIRLDFPGVSALNFEMMFDILVREVIGWDMLKDEPTDKPGYFGMPFAFSASMEEQGRKTIHGHMSVWIKGYRELQDTVFFGGVKDQRMARGVLAAYYDHIASTKMFPTTRHDLRKAFDHDCTVPINVRENPAVVNDQQLRYLRHRCGYKDADGVFAQCVHCSKTFTVEHLLAKFLRQNHNFGVQGDADGTTDNGKEDDDTTTEEKKQDTNQNDTEETDKSNERIPKAALFAHIIQYQKKKDSSVPKVAINAAYQHHSSCHVKGCFKCSGKKKHTCNAKCECRYRIPDRSRKFTTLKTHLSEASWYEWTGREKKQPIVQVLPKRNTYDCFVNVSCPAISHSKFSCNSNVSLITDGPIGAYQYKYQHKATQQSELEHYSEVEKKMKLIHEEDRVHDSDRSEALRHIVRAAFAHNKTNVINAPLASYLIRNEERFYFSHDFIYCPLSDLVRIHNNQTIAGTLNYSPDGNCFFVNQSLHYLCRPECHEHECAKEFFETNEFAYIADFKKKKGDDPLVPFLADTDFYKHPSAKATGRGGKGPRKCKQGVKPRRDRARIKISQWGFPDTSTFNGNLFSCPVEDINASMEKYSQMVLTLLLPHRSAEDLRVLGVRYQYTMKLREVMNDDNNRKLSNVKPLVFTDENTTFLQNIQNAAYNCFRYKVGEDDLQSNTHPYENPNFVGNDNEDDDNHDEDSVMDGEEDYEQLLGTETEYQPPVNDRDPAYLNEFLNDLDFSDLVNKGTNRCGTDCNLQPPSVSDDSHILQEPFLQTTQDTTNDTPENTSTTPSNERKQYSMKTLVTLLLKRSTARERRNVWKNQDITAPDATGTIKSIRAWARAALNGDKRQIRAFETIIASFLLTFYAEEHTEPEDEAVTGERYHLKFRRQKLALMKLRGSERDAQLLCLLHGPGGSGKSTVIDLVLAYARAFCDELGHPFTNRTVVVTAMSGVAATLLHGETTHMAMGLNRDELDSETVAAWADTRLLIIDEISFAGPCDFEKMQANCAVLMKERYKVYGGLNIVFAGDYSQLEPVKKATVYQDGICAEFHHAVNLFIELEGTWRFRDDPRWGKILRRFREGHPTLEDVQEINEHCCNRAIPKGIQVATFRNRDRDAVNTAIFDQYCIQNKPADNSVLHTAVVIMMDDLKIRNGKKVYSPIQSNTVKKHFYQSVGEDDCVCGSSRHNAKGRVDPVLKLYPRCPMMLTKNTDVGNGEANGSRVQVLAVKVKLGEQPFHLRLDNGTTVNALYASQVQHILLEHECEDIVPRTFKQEAQEFTFNSELQFGEEMERAALKGEQFPVISNTCTTGHKLQGCTLAQLLVNDWFYTANWPYVVLSRVKTMDGLYLRVPLSEDLSKYDMPEGMLLMLEYFRNKCSVQMLTEDQYKEIELLSE